MGKQDACARRLVGLVEAGGEHDAVRTSASMMTEAVRGREAALAQQLQQRFRAVLTGQLEPDQAQLGKLISLAGVRRYPSRIKCALLGWHALMHALGETADAGDTAAAKPDAGTDLPSATP